MTVTPGYRGLRRTPNRTALLAAAEELFGAQGLGAVSVDEIVARAGVAKGTFYNHFRDKEDIAEQTALAIRYEIRDRIEMLKSSSRDPAVHVAIAIILFLQLAVMRPRRAQVLAALLSGSTDANAKMNAPLRKTLELGMSRKRFRIRSIDAAMLLVIGAVSAGVRKFADAKRKSSQAQIIEIVVHVLMGLGLSSDEAERDIVRPLATRMLWEQA